jgi:type I restriction-modification system DNA methylase subunit
MSSAASGLVNKVWNYCNLLRDDGVSYGDYVEQLTYLLFLKMDYERTRPPYNKKSTIPSDHNWASRADLDDFVRNYNPANRHERTETERFHRFSYEDLLKRDKANLDIFWLRDDSLGDSSDLPDPAILAAEIVEDLQAALDQFAQIASDLSAVERSTREP